MAISFKEYAPDQYVVTPQETLPGMMQSLADQEEEEEEAEDTIFELGSDRMTLEFSSSCTQVGATCSSDDSQNFNGTAATFSTSPVHLSNGPVHPLSGATCDQFIAAEEEPPMLNPPCELTGFYQGITFNINSASFYVKHLSQDWCLNSKYLSIAQWVGGSTSLGFLLCTKHPVT